MSVYESGSDIVITSTSLSTKGTIKMGETPVVTVNEGTPGVELYGEGNLVVTQAREATAATAGRNLTLRAGGAKAAGTDLAGGDLILQGGINTGSGLGGAVKLQTAPAGSTGTTDGTHATAVEVRPNGDVLLGLSGLAAAATGGFAWIPFMATAPSGAPGTETGHVPICYCAADNKLYINEAGTGTWVASAAFS